MNNSDSLLSRVMVGVTAMAVVLVPATALGQVPPPSAPPPGELPPVQEPMPTAQPSPEVAPAPTPAPAQAPPPTPVAEEYPLPIPAAPEPEPEPPAQTFTVTTGVGLRAALRLQGDDPETMDDLWVDELYVEPRFGGRVTPIVGWTANLQVSGRTPDSDSGGPTRLEVRALDLVGQLDFMDEFNIWVGRMLTPSDRSNFSGAWFMSPWNYPGLYQLDADTASYVGPRGTEEFGREVGTVVWGNDASGQFKYYLAMMDLDNRELSPLLAGRINLAAIGSEPGFYGSSTYYGAKDMLVLGAGARYQKRAVDTPDEVDELFEFNADLLAEFTIPDGGGTLTGEAGYYYFGADNPVSPVEHALFGLVSYLVPGEIGPGKLQAAARVQTTFEPDWRQYEFYLSYLMKEYFAKLVLGFTQFDIPGPVDPRMLQLGFQIQQ